ncbi:hypothetical protein CR513_16175, partial [Mucuna pruriens]
MASGSSKPLSYEMVAANRPNSCTLLLLKDYLRDDLSSCSSNGFRSLPRRQCCLRPRSSAKSVLQKALEAVFNAVKSRRCRAKKAGVGVLSRSFHRRLLNRRFWKRASKGTNSWPHSVFTCSLTDADMEGSVATTTNTCSITNSAREHYGLQVDSRRKQDWPTEKGQFSPVSILDCPLFDDDEEITSPFNSPLCSTPEGVKHKHIQKSRHYNRVGSVKPVDLEKKMTWSEKQEDEAIYNDPTKPCPVLESITSTRNGNSNLFRDNVEKNALDLLTRVKKSIPCVCLRTEAEKLVFDFLKESIWENINIGNSMKQQLCKVAEDWIRGQTHEQYLNLQTGKGREIYVEEMNKWGSWRTFGEEIQRLALELELEFSTSLVNELVVDFTTCCF